MVRLQTVHHQTPHFRYSNGTEDVGASEHRSTGSNTFWKRFVFFIFSSFSLRKRPPQALRRAFSCFLPLRFMIAVSYTHLLSYEWFLQILNLFFRPPRPVFHRSSAVPSVDILHAGDPAQPAPNRLQLLEIVDREIQRDKRRPCLLYTSRSCAGAGDILCAAEAQWCA